MRRPSAFLRTRVARRMLLAFTLCAVLPVTLLAVVSYTSVRRSLTLESDGRLKSTARRSGMVLLTRLARLADALTSDEMARQLTDTGRVVPERAGFQALYHVSATGVRRLAGRSADVPAVLSAVQRERLARGAPLLVVDDTAGRRYVWMGRRTTADGDLSWGLIHPAALDALDQEEVEGVSRTCLYLQVPSDATACSPAELAGPFLNGSVAPPSPGRLLTIQADGEPYLVASWQVFLPYEYGTGSWTVASAQPMAIVTAPVRRFRSSFLLAVALALVVVFFAANVQIRRSIDPIAVLRDGASRVAKGDFDVALTVDTKDELSQLADGFNHMTRSLSTQFASLSAIEAVDQSVLGQNDALPLVETAIRCLRAMTPATRIVFAVREEGVIETARVIAASAGATSVDLGRRPFGAVAAQLRNAQRQFVLRENTPLFELLSVPNGGGEETVVLPLVHDQAVTGLVALTLPVSLAHDVDLTATRLLADRVALALSNVQLVQRLDYLSLGTLTAFARAIDANSPWTAGHSERVTRLSLVLADRLGLSQSERVILQRAGLVHDVGKIGIPPQVLDKPGPLSRPERALIQSHPVLGERILRPIGSFAELLPVVRSHHERMDGTGYPDGLAGEAIPYLARVVAVADVYDALVSDRPYRAGWTPANAMREIERMAGPHLDPGVVSGFLSVKLDEELAAIYASTADAHALAIEVDASRATVAPTVTTSSGATW